MSPETAPRTRRPSLSAACLAQLLALACSARSVAQGSFEIDFIVGGQHGDIETFIAELGQDLTLPIEFVQSWPRFGLEEYRVIGASGLGSQGLIESSIAAAVAKGALTNGGLDIPYALETGSGQTGSIWVTCLCTASDFESQYGGVLVQSVLARGHATGRGVVIGVVDSGLVSGVPITTAASVQRGYSWIRPPGYEGSLPIYTTSSAPGDLGNGIDDDQDGNVDEGVGHGTFISGLITLVAPEARQRHYRVLDDEGHCQMSEVISAMHQALNDRVHVINLSLVPSQPSPVMVNVFEEARNSGVTVAVSAGNYGSPGQPSANPYTCTSEPEPRCSAPNIVQVGATDWNDARWANSDWGDWVDVYAPGVTFYNTGGIPGIPEQRLIAPIGVDPANPANVVYATASGTSFATAFVTGAAAAFRSTRPDWPSPSVPLQEIPTRFMQELATRSQRDGTTPAGIPRLAAFDLVSPQPMNRLRAPDIVDDGGFPYRRSLGGGDMAAVLGSWGPVGPGYLVTADADDDGVITGGDLVPVLGSWGVIDP